jgi:hypothetical protein
METSVDIDQLDIQKFAESLVAAGREGVKWERRRLEWIREEKAKQAAGKSDAV